MLPSELFLKRKLWTWFNLMLVNIKEYVCDIQTSWTWLTHLTLFSVSGILSDDQRLCKWIPGVVLRKFRPLTLHNNALETRDGKMVKQHADKLRLWKESSNICEVIEDSSVCDNHQYWESVIQELKRYPDTNWFPPTLLPSKSMLPSRSVCP